MSLSPDSGFGEPPKPRRVRKKVFRKGIVPVAPIAPLPVPPVRKEGPDRTPRLSAKQRAETARGWYQCSALHISYVGFCWKKPPACLECGRRTVSITWGELEDGKDRIVNR